MENQEKKKTSNCAELAKMLTAVTQDLVEAQRKISVWREKYLQLRLQLFRLGIEPCTEINEEQEGAKIIAMH